MSLTAVGIGEILWDVFPDGAHFGGAPANFAAHIASLQAKAFVVSRIGTDELGKKAEQRLAENQIDATYVQIDEKHPTGTVDVQLSSDGKATYEFASDTAWDHLQWHDDLSTLASQCDVVCFGTLGQRSPIARQSIRNFVEATSSDCLRVLDVNLRQEFFDSEIIRHSLKIANAFKLNDEELPTVMKLCGMTDTSSLEINSPQYQQAVWDLAHRFDLKWITITAGGDGAALYIDNQIFNQSTPETEVVDTVGAGDSFTATLVADLCRGVSPADALRHATHVAAFVCTQPGATPKLPTELLSV